MLNLAAISDKKQIVLGLEPTGHYWFALAAWMISKEISVVQVNPYAVKQSKEIEDNTQHKDDRKDSKMIANLVKDENYGMPYLPEKVYADLRRLSMFRDQLAEDRIRHINRLHRELKIYFPEYMDAFGKIDGAVALEVLKMAPMPEDILVLGEAGLRETWHEAKLRGCGYSRAKEIVEYAGKGMTLFWSLAGTQCMNRWDEGSWDTIPLGTEGSSSQLIRGKIAFIKQNKRMLLKLYLEISYSVLDTTIFITRGSVYEVNKIRQSQ